MPSSRTVPTTGETARSVAHTEPDTGGDGDAGADVLGGVVDAGGDADADGGVLSADVGGEVSDVDWGVGECVSDAVAAVGAVAEWDDMGGG
ncbi:hypothetical protein [Halosegnis sp.]|uniref:hypothetical protein n=1 Tax=Halosegnis sp. TaxID=2864959 RepID=UPI0035D48B30